ncbi:hypothetical protein HAX54_021050, partial [Datura stramonium]|nr:hypothetical protein [Datura stramonium]
ELEHIDNTDQVREDLNKDSCRVMEFELKKMLENVQAIHDEMFFLREREAEMQELNRSTNSKMAWLTGLSILLCLSVAGLQNFSIDYTVRGKAMILSCDREFGLPMLVRMMAYSSLKEDLHIKIRADRNYLL